MSVLVFVVLGVLILWHFHAGAMEAITAGDASVLSALPLVLGRWVELGVAFVVSVFAVFVPGGNDDDNYS